MLELEGKVLTEGLGLKCSFDVQLAGLPLIRLFPNFWVSGSDTGLKDVLGMVILLEKKM